MYDSSTKKVENVFDQPEIAASILYARVLNIAFAVNAGLFAIVALVVNAVSGPFAGSADSTIGGIISAISIVPIMVLVFIPKRLTSVSGQAD